MQPEPLAIMELKWPHLKDVPAPCKQHRHGTGGTHGFPPGMPVKFGGMAGTRM